MQDCVVMEPGMLKRYFRDRYDRSVKLFRNFLRNISGVKGPRKDSQSAVMWQCGVLHALVNHCSVLQSEAKPHQTHASVCAGFTFTARHQYLPVFIRLN